MLLIKCMQLCIALTFIVYYVHRYVNLVTNNMGMQCTYRGLGVETDYVHFSWF